MKAGKKIREKLARGEKKEVFLLIQLVIAGLIFVLFLLNVFFSLSWLLPYLLAPLVVANIVFRFINHTKGLLVNVVFLLLIPGLFIIIIEYVVSIIGAGLGLYHLVRLGIGYWKGHV